MRRPDGPRFAARDRVPLRSRAPALRARGREGDRGGERGAARRGPRGSRGRCSACRAERSPPAPPRTRRSPPLHGLHWLVSNLSERIPGRPPRGRRPLGGRRLAALPRLPRDAGRGSAGAGRRDGPDRGAPDRAGARSTRCSLTPGATVVEPAPAVRGGGGRARRREARWRGRARVRARLPRGERRQPLLLRRAALGCRRARRGARCPRGGLGRRHRPRDRRPRRPRPPRPPARAVHPARPGRRGPRRAAPSCATPRPWRGSTRSEDEAARSADALGGRRASCGDERPLDFAHPIVRTSIYRSMGPLERAEMHSRAARELFERGADAEDVAVHLLEVEPSGDSRVADVLRESAAAAAQRGAPRMAATHLERALEEPPPREHDPAPDAGARAGPPGHRAAGRSADPEARSGDGRRPAPSGSALALRAARALGLAYQADSVRVGRLALEGADDQRRPTSCGWRPSWSPTPRSSPSTLRWRGARSPTTATRRRRGAPPRR